MPRPSAALDASSSGGPKGSRDEEYVAVAVKQLVLDRIDEANLRDFYAEVALMKTLRHPNIVGFLGACSDPICLVTEYCSNGNLFNILQNKAKGGTPLTWRTLLGFALDEARGMQFLHAHEPVIIHRDLKSLNLLLDRQWTLKISDFGLSRFKAKDAGLMTGACGTYHWMAPEVITSNTYAESADVFSFGINLWELITREIPYSDKYAQPVQIAMAVVNRQERPTVPASIAAAIKACPANRAAEAAAAHGTALGAEVQGGVQYLRLMRRCWSQGPAQRPTMAEIVAQLEALLRRLS